MKNIINTSYHLYYSLYQFFLQVVRQKQGIRTWHHVFLQYLWVQSFTDLTGSQKSSF